MTTAFHAVCVAAACTGGLMLVTGGDFGAYAPILIALGLYAIVFAVVAELVFTAQHFVGGAVRRRSQRVLATGVSKP